MASRQYHHTVTFHPVTHSFLDTANVAIPSSDTITPRRIRARVIESGARARKTQGELALLESLDSIPDEVRERATSVADECFKTEHRAGSGYKYFLAAAALGYAYLNYAVTLADFL